MRLSWGRSWPWLGLILGMLLPVGGLSAAEHDADRSAAVTSEETAEKPARTEATPSAAPASSQRKTETSPLDPDRARARFQLGRKAYQRGDYETALRLWAPLKPLIPSRIWHANMAAALIGLGRLEEAATHLEVALEQDEAVAPLWRMLKSIRAHQARAAWAEAFEGTPPPAVYRTVLTPEWEMGTKLTRKAYTAVWQALERWRKAREAQDPRAYFMLYARDFQPASGQTLKAWMRMRRQQLRAPRFIRVEIDELRLEATPTGHIRTLFRERFESSTTRQVLYRALDWAYTPEGWRIVREGTLR